MDKNPNELIHKAQSGDKEVFDELVMNNMGLVRTIAKRFAGRGTDMEDLIQIGSIGLIKAVRHFDLSAGTKLSTYAVPLITGEIKKFLRDDGAIKVSRDIKHNSSVVSRKRREYITEHGEEPNVSTLAAICEMSEEDVIRACEASAPMLSFSEPAGDTTLENLIGMDSIGEMCEKISLRQALALLEKDEKDIIVNRYFLGRSQKETGDALSMTQVMVSRKEKKIMEKLKEYLL